eukprot:maker-scaffold96_size378025-snap-gene-2.45 protein:Tk04985 transcript:maker-scaffold96_size378025-snap-gene-2.45-mRNA-1 annotation:"slain2 protein"
MSDLPAEALAEPWQGFDLLAGPPGTPSRKKSLVSKLDGLKVQPGWIKESPVSDRMLMPGPGATSSPVANRLVFSSIAQGYRPKFDGKTFTRMKKHQSPSPVRTRVDQVFNSQRLNETFQVEETDTGLNATFTRMDNSQANHTFEVNRNVNLDSTFQIPPPSGGRSSSSRRTSDDVSERLARFSSEDRLSIMSDGSTNHPLNDVGDVQNIARLQEESLNQPADYFRRHSHHHNAPMSPGSDLTSPHTPPTDAQSEASDDIPPECQYSSQDSLPDSPYSSQSLDSQAAQNQDRLRRSMPNLNKRGAKALRPVYGLSKDRHASSDQRIVPSSQPPRWGPTSNNPGPQRGTIARAETGMRPPTKIVGLRASGLPSRIAQPVASGIPRPGSRLPMFNGGGTRGGVPRPSRPTGGRDPKWMEDCY